MSDDGHENPAPILFAAGKTLEELHEAAEACTACELYRDATQVVFGSGSNRARIMLLGEQPGDQEDQQGEPFVGPAGGVLDEALTEAGIPPEVVYTTNIVKHFRWKARGKKRLHQKPSTRHVRACRPWLDAELALVEPDVVVALGASAAQTILGGDVRVMRDHGRAFEWEDVLVVPTIHPSFVLRAPDEDERHRLRAMLVEDLRKAGELAG